MKAVTFTPAIDDIAGITLTRSIANGDAMALKVVKRATNENDVVSAPPPREFRLSIGDDAFGAFTLYELIDNDPLGNWATDGDTQQLYYTWSLRRENDADSARAVVLRELTGTQFTPGRSVAGGSLLLAALRTSNSAQRKDLYRVLARYRLGFSHLPAAGLHLGGRLIELDDAGGDAIEIVSYESDTLSYGYAPDNFPGDWASRRIVAQFKTADDDKPRPFVNGNRGPDIHLNDVQQSAEDALTLIRLERQRLRNQSVSFGVKVAAADVPLERIAPGHKVRLNGRTALVTDVSHMLTDFDHRGAGRQDCTIKASVLAPTDGTVR